MFELADESPELGAKIKVIGVGGGGGNAVNTMMGSHLAGVDFIVANTDAQALKGNRAPHKLQLGENLTKGLGAGANPEIGRKAAIESEDKIAKRLEGADMVFITAGMGGGTGTGAAPVIARVSKDLGCLTVGVVTKPFAFEGKRRSRFAQQGIEELQASVDTLITIPNERLLLVAGKETSMLQAFQMADEVLLHAVSGISDLVLVEGLINLDFADVRVVMKEMGMALMGSATASGEHRAIEAATRAISSPLLESVSITGATGILLNVTGGPNLTLYEVNEAAKLIQEEAHEEANIIFGAVIRPELKDEVRVTVIATGFNRRVVEVAPPVRMMPSLVREPLEERGEARLEEVPSDRMPGSVSSFRSKGSARSELKKIISEVGYDNLVAMDLDGDEYDIPTFLRKQAD